MQAPTTTAFTLDGVGPKGTGRGAVAPYPGFVSTTGLTAVPAFGTVFVSTSKATPVGIPYLWLN